MIYKYPCGCEGLGGPPEPVRDGRIIRWENVWVIYHCDDPEGPELGIPVTRDLSGAPGEVPVRMYEQRADTFHKKMLSLTIDAQKYRAIVGVLKDIRTEVADGQE